MPSNFASIDQALRDLHYYPLEETVTRTSAVDLDRLQMQYGCTLSPDYRHFLSTYGPGGLERGAVVALPSGSHLGPHFSIDILYSLGEREDWNPFHVLESQYKTVLPSLFLPIATDAGGNLLLLQCGTGAVFAWDHEHRELTGDVIDRLVHELGAGGLEVEKYDIGQLILMWERHHPELIKNPTGHGNLYRVADSFAQLLTAAKPHPNQQ